MASRVCTLGFEMMAYADKVFIVGNWNCDGRADINLFRDLV